MAADCIPDECSQQVSFLVLLEFSRERQLRAHAHQHGQFAVAGSEQGFNLDFAIGKNGVFDGIFTGHGGQGETGSHLHFMV